MDALTPTSKYGKKMINEECDDRLRKLPVYANASWILVLLDKGHVKSSEIQEILAEVEELYQSITNNYLSLDDVCRTVMTEYGIRLNFVDNIKDKNPWLRNKADKNSAQKKLPLPEEPSIDEILRNMGVSRSDPPHWVPNIHRAVDKNTGKTIRECTNGFLCSNCGKHSWHTKHTCSGCGKTMLGGFEDD